MKYYTRRRVVALVILATVTAIFLIFFDGFRVTLRDPNLLSGWFLLAIILALALFNVRKKFPVPPAGPSRIWLQAHIYGGAFSLIPYFMHAGIQIPTGAIDRILAVLFFSVAISGVVGLFMSRVLPRRLTSRGSEIIFERLPEHRRLLKETVDKLVEDSVAATQSTTIATFYTERLRSFFDGPRHFYRHLFEIAPPLGRVISEIEDQYRYLNDEEKVILERIAACVRQKDALDYQYALQFALKAWLFIHIPLTNALLVLLTFHVWLAYAFTGRTL